MIEKNKILLEVIINPIPRKRIELLQTLKGLLANLKKICSNFNIKETNENIRLIAEMKSEEQLDKAINSYEFKILKGAVNTLAIETDIIINGVISDSNVFDVN